MSAQIAASAALKLGQDGGVLTLSSERRRLEFRPTDDGMAVYLLSAGGDQLASSRNKRNEPPRISGRDLCIGQAYIALDVGEIDVVGAWLAGRFGARP